ncbi:MAG: hypothetical protein JWQ96_2548 [Segetibacter sp.]|nr:hypothetical protein [Segetibacter sp.]
MKKTILSIAIAAIFAACNSNPKTVGQLTNNSNEIATADTSGLAAFQKSKEELATIEGQGVEEFSENTSTSASEVAPTVVYRDLPAKTTRVAKAPVRNARTGSVARTSSPKPVYSGNRTSTSRPSTGTGSTGTGAETGVSVGAGEPVVVTEPAEVPAAKKEGWSKAAKGTAIGAGSGAVLGAIISKNKGKGAVIGGIVGAAGGYVLGRKQDKKEGRY